MGSTIEQYVIISRPPKAIVAYVFAQYFFLFYWLVGLDPQSEGYGGPPWQLGVRV